MAARGGPPDPTAEEKLPHPIIQSVPKLHKTIRHPGKARLPRLYGPPPPPCEAPMHRRPPHQSRAQAHAPTHAPGGTPTRTQAPQAQPLTPTRRQSAPRSQTPPPDQPRNSAAARLATYVRRHRHPQQRRMPPPEKQHPRVTIPHPGQGRSPSADPPRNPPPGNPQMPQAHIATPRNNKNHSRTESGPPPTLGDGADQRSPERLI